MNPKEHLWHYLLLVLILSLGFWGFFSLGNDPSANQKIRFFSLFASVLGYVVWGVWHHFVERRLSWALAGEYLLLGLVVLAIASLIIFPL